MPSRPSTGNAFQALVASLAAQLQAKFPSEDAAVIESEINNYMESSGSVKPEDLVAIEARIRARLDGDTPPPMTRSLQRRKLMDNDDWARMNRADALEAEQEEKAKQARLAEQRRKIREELDAQVREKEAKRLQELDSDRKFHEAEVVAVKEWEQEEAAKRAKRFSAMQQIKVDREGQIAARQSALEAAAVLRRQEEDELLRAAYEEYKTTIAAEAEVRKQQRERLEKVKEENVENLKLRAEEKKRLIEEDMMYNKLYEEVLSKQEKLRFEQLEKMKIWQAKTEKDAQQRPPAKRWIDESIIEGYLKKKEAEDAKRDETEKKKRIEMNETVKRTLDEQIKTKKLEKERRAAEERAYADKIAAEAADARRKDVEKKRALGEAKQRVRSDLDKQMQEDAARKRVVLMTDTERQINREKLERLGLSFTNSIKF